MCEPGVHVVRDSTHDQASLQLHEFQASLQLHEFQKKLTAAGALAKFKFLSSSTCLTKPFCFACVFMYLNDT